MHTNGMPLCTKGTAEACCLGTIDKLQQVNDDTCLLQCSMLLVMGVVTVRRQHVLQAFRASVQQPLCSGTCPHHRWQSMI